MDTLRLMRRPKDRPYPSEASKLVRISADIWYEIDSLSAETGLSMTMIANKLCRYAMDHVELVEPPKVEFK